MNESMFDPSRAHKKLPDPRPDPRRIRELVTTPSTVEGRHYEMFVPLHTRMLEDGLTIGAVLSSCKKQSEQTSEQKGNTCDELLHAPEFLYQYRVLKTHIDHELERFREEEGAFIPPQSPFYLVGMPGMNRLLSRALQLGLLKEVYDRVAQENKTAGFFSKEDTHLNSESGYYQRLAQKAVVRLFEVDPPSDAPPISILLSKLISTRGRASAESLVQEFCARSIRGNEVFEDGQKKGAVPMIYEHALSPSFITEKERASFRALPFFLVQQMRGYFRTPQSETRKNTSSENTEMYDLAREEGRRMLGEDWWLMTEYEQSHHLWKERMQSSQKLQSFFEREQTIRYAHAQDRVDELKRIWTKRPSGEASLEDLHRFLSSAPPIDEEPLRAAKKALEEAQQEKESKGFALFRNGSRVERIQALEDVIYQKKEEIEKEKQRRQEMQGRIDAWVKDMRVAQLEADEARQNIGSITREFEADRIVPERPLTRYHHDAEAVRKLLENK